MKLSADLREFIELAVVMMIRRIQRGFLVLLGCGAWTFGVHAQGGGGETSATSVEVTVHGLFDTEGDLRVALYDDPRKFESGKHGVFFKERVVSPEADPKGATVVFDELEMGREYAIAMFHDRDENDQFNASNNERFGFSNNAKPRLKRFIGLIPYGGKPPKWETAKFECCGAGGAQMIIARKPVLGTPLVEVEGIEIPSD